MFLDYIMVVVDIISLHKDGTIKQKQGKDFRKQVQCPKEIQSAENVMLATMFWMLWRSG